MVRINSPKFLHIIITLKKIHNENNENNDDDDEEVQSTLSNKKKFVIQITMFFI